MLLSALNPLQDMMRPDSWLQIDGGHEIRPILRRGNEHAAVLYHRIDNTSPPLTLSKTDLTGLSEVGHWFVSVVNLEHEVQSSLGIFSSEESEVIVQPGEVAVLRLHQWDQTVGTGSAIVLPTSRSPQHVELLPPAFRRCKVWTADLASRVFFSMVHEQFGNPKHASRLLKRMFLPVPNKAICYFYFSSKDWSEFSVRHDLSEAPLLFVTYYDRCGHAFAGRSIMLRDGEHVTVEHRGSVVLGRVVPRSEADLCQLREKATLALQAYEDITHGKKQCSRLAKQIRVALSEF